MMVVIYMVWVTFTFLKVTLVLKGTNRFWGNICCHPDDVLFRDVPAYFSKAMSGHILHVY